MFCSFPIQQKLKLMEGLQTNKVFFSETRPFFEHLLSQVYFTIEKLSFRAIRTKKKVEIVNWSLLTPLLWSWVFRFSFWNLPLGQIMHFAAVIACFAAKNLLSKSNFIIFWSFLIFSMVKILLFQKVLNYGLVSEKNSSSRGGGQPKVIFFIFEPFPYQQNTPNSVNTF